MLPLHGVGVLVTRPAQQAAPLCRLLELQGASTLRLPVIDIRGHGDGRELAERLGDLGQFAVIIFTSANAARFGVSLLEDRRDLTLAAIGPATSRALVDAGYSVAVQPDGTFDSEGLLRHPRLEHLAGRRVLIVKGSDGRGLLEQEIVRRGAEVLTADVYRRIPAQPDDSVLTALLDSFRAGALQVITATSVEIAAHLLDLATPALRAEFDRAQWLVPGERVAAGIRARGVTAPLLRAASAEDQDLVSALLRWRATLSGA